VPLCALGADAALFAVLLCHHAINATILSHGGGGFVLVEGLYV